MKMLKHIVIPAILALAAARPVSLHADSISLQLNNPNQTAIAGGHALSFSGKVTNTSSTTLYFTSDNLLLSLNSSLFTFADDGFYNNLFSLAPGESYSGELFTLAILKGAAAGNYQGTYTLFGGLTDMPDRQVGLGSATLQASVQATTPEPSGIVLMVSGALAILGALRFYRPRSVAF